MRLIEITYTVSDDGHLHVPADDLADMGIAPGETAALAFLSSDGRANDFREFLVSAEPFTRASVTEPNAISIPVDLLRQVNISDDANVEIACADGAILITASDDLSISDLEELLSSLETANESLISLIRENNLPQDV